MATAGSEDLYDLACQPCQLDGQLQEAVGLCTDCQDYLCQNCFDVHTLPIPSRNHELVTKDQMLKSQISLKRKDKCSEKCTVHEDDVIKFYCTNHCKLGCGVCIALDHRACVSVRYIPKEARNLANNVEFTQTETRLKLVEERCKKLTTENYQMKTEALEIGCSEAVKMVHQFRKEINETLDKIETDLITKCEAVRSEEYDQLAEIVKTFKREQKELLTLSVLIETYRTNKQSCSLYTTMMKLKDKLKIAEDKMTEAEKKLSYANSQIKFVANKETLHSLTHTDALGVVTRTEDLYRKAMDEQKELTKASQIMQDLPTSDGNQQMIVKDLKDDLTECLANALNTLSSGSVDEASLKPKFIPGRKTNSPEYEVTGGALSSVTEPMEDINIHKAHIGNIVRSPQGFARKNESSEQNMTVYKYEGRNTLHARIQKGDGDRNRQWIAVGKKHYDRAILLQLQFESASMVKPVGLPDIPDIILDKPTTVDRNKAMRGDCLTETFEFTNKYVWLQSDPSGNLVRKNPTKSTPRQLSHQSIKEEESPLQQIGDSISTSSKLKRDNDDLKPPQKTKSTQRQVSHPSFKEEESPPRLISASTRISNVSKLKRDNDDVNPTEKVKKEHDGDDTESTSRQLSHPSIKEEEFTPRQISASLSNVSKLKRDNAAVNPTEKVKKDFDEYNIPYDVDKSFGAPRMPSPGLSQQPTTMYQPHQQQQGMRGSNAPFFQGRQPGMRQLFPANMQSPQNQAQWSQMMYLPFAQPGNQHQIIVNPLMPPQRMTAQPFTPSSNIQTSQQQGMYPVPQQGMSYQQPYHNATVYYGQNNSQNRTSTTSGQPTGIPRKKEYMRQPQRTAERAQNEIAAIFAKNVAKAIYDPSSPDVPSDATKQFQSPPHSTPSPQQQQKHQNVPPGPLHQNVPSKPP